MIPLMNVTRELENYGSELGDAVLKVLNSGQYILGPEVAEFEKKFAEFCGARYAIGVGNGTDALVIALRALCIGKEDEVIVPAMSFFATAEAVAAVGATPVFVDVNKESYVIDPVEIEKKLTKKTKAIIPVHLYGQCVDMDAIMAIAKEHNLYVIEDCAQAAGAEYKGKKAGTIGDIGCVSFFPTKNLGCAGDGGMIVTDDENLYRMCMAYRVHGSGMNGLFAYGKENGVEVDTENVDFGGNLPKYFNYVIGYNSRLDTIQAAVLNIKLPFLDKRNQKRREIAQKYEQLIQNDLVKKPICSTDNVHIYYVYVLLVENRDHFCEYMKENGIATGVYFPVPLHLQKVFENLGYTQGDLPNSEYLADHGVAIPMFAELNEKEVEHVISVINKYEG